MGSEHGETITPEQPLILDFIRLSDEEIRVRFAFEGKAYDVTGSSLRTTEEEFSTWLTDYADKTPRCACCDGVIFPGQSVTGGNIVPNDSGFSHLSEQCNDTAAGYCGTFNENGELISPF